MSVPLRCSSVIVKIACERDEAAFMAVEPTVRAEFPSSRQPTISWAENTSRSVRPTIYNRKFSTKTRDDQLSISHPHKVRHWRNSQELPKLIFVFSPSEITMLLFLVNMSVTHLDAIFRVFSNADGRFIFGCTQQVQYIFIVDLKLNLKHVQITSKVSSERGGNFLDARNHTKFVQINVVCKQIKIFPQTSKYDTARENSQSVLISFSWKIIPITRGITPTEGSFS